MELKVNYRAPGPVVEAFLQSDAFVRGIRGPFGSGKSTACAVDILRKATQQKPSADGKRHTRFAVVRNTYPELKTTTITTWHEIVPALIGRWVDQGPPTHHLTGDDLDCEVLFLALDSPADVRKLLSMNLTGAWVNEAREVPKAVIDGITGRVGRYPPMSMGGPTWSGVTLDTNPPDTDHWWYLLAERDTGTPAGRRLIDSVVASEEELRKMGLLLEGQRLFEFFAQPSGLSDLAENRDVLPAGYYQRMMAGKTEEWINVYVRGSYGFVLDGRPVYPEYTDAVHYRESLEPWRDVSLRIGLDFGLTPAATIAQRSLSGNWRFIDEVVTEHMGAIRFGKELKRHLEEHYGNYDIESITGDPAGNAALGDDEEQTVFSILKGIGVDARPADSNDWTPRREAVAHGLTQLIDGQPAVLIGPRCKVLRKALMGGYQYKRVQIVGDERFHDKPNKNAFSHVAEAMQYAMLGGGEGRAIIRGNRRPSGPVKVIHENWDTT